MNYSELCKEINNNPDKYCLLQYFNEKEFCYSILDLDNLKYIVFKKIDLRQDKNIFQNIEEITKKEELFDLSFYKRYLLISSLKSTLIPALFFSEEDIKTYFQFVHELSEYDELNYNYITSIKTYNVFSINSELVHLLNKRQKSIIFHSNFVTIETIMRLINVDDCVYLYNNGNILEISIKEQNNLRYFNQFILNDENDFLYYVKLIFEQLKLNNNLNFYYSGNSKYEKSILKYISKYFKKPLILEINWPEVDLRIDSNIKYKYFNLLYLYNCELLEENIKEEY